MTPLGNVLQNAVQAAQEVSWPQVALTVGLAINTTLSALLLRRRQEADVRDTGEYLGMKLRLDRIENSLEELREECPKLKGIR